MADLTVSRAQVPTGGPVRPGSPGLDALLARIGEGAAERERDRTPPHAEVALLRAARLGALRLPVADGAAAPRCGSCSRS
jgi:hypothetical protein